jgi:hypothetical protein
VKTLFKGFLIGCLVGAVMAFSDGALAAEESVPIDASPQAVEAAYEAVRNGDATPVISLKETAEAMLVKLINAATQTGEFIADQIPIVIKELLTYYTALYVVCMLAGALLLLTAWKLLLYTIKRDRELAEAAGYYDGYWWFMLFAIIPLTVVAGFLLVEIVNLLKITLAPRVWLIEYAASLVK